ncbi:uncharacterized protein PWA37_003429 [Arxiozyma heterogenica]|uniref:uncharacterized protein n=1 Tax=Arxiozyma heterogenica TaxID=278026 RepID=UPI002EDFD67B
MSEFPTNPIFVQAIKVAQLFTGSTRSVFTLREFLLSLELKFSLFNVTDDFRKICIFFDNIGSKATQWFYIYVVDHDIHTTSYSNFVSHFSAYFGAQIDTNNVGRKLRLLSQHDNIDGYIKEFYQYKDLLPDGAISKPELVRYFIKGLKPDTRKVVISQIPITLYEAVELARRCERRLIDPIFLNITSKVSSDSSPVTVEANDDTGMAIRTSYRNRRGYSTYSAHASAFRRGRSHNSTETKSSYDTSSKRDKEDLYRLCLEYKLCFNCHKPGHQSSICPNARVG